MRRNIVNLLESAKTHYQPPITKTWLTDTCKPRCCGEWGIRILFFNILTPFHMCLIPPIIHFYNEILGYKICFSPSQLSHTILSVSPRCNFFIPKMRQKHPHLHPHNLLMTNKIIIILLTHAFSLEGFFSISHYWNSISVKKYPR